MAQERSDSLEERLKSHAESFNGLLSLIPAKYYYGEDTSDQWQRKKQTKEEARAAKRAKLDPDNAKSAKDVLDEQAANARKRKREEDGSGVEVEVVEPEAPIPSSVKKGKQTKKQKREGKGTASEPPKTKSKENGALSKSEEDPEAVRKAKAEKKREKKERKKAKEEAKAVKAKAKKERKAQEAALEEDSEAATGVPDASDEEDDDDAQRGEIDHIDMEDILEESRDHPSSTATPSTARSPAFDASANHSGSSSISSIAAPTTKEPQPKGSTEPQTDSQPPKPDPSELKARLAQRIEDLRKSRHADGPAPARTRQELIESRRQKEEARRAHKKELRQKAKEEERQKQADTLARGSLLLSGSPLLSPGSPLTPSSEPNNFSFNRIAFSNGQHASANLDAIIDPKTKAKGPSDPHTALLAAQKKAARLNGLDESKRADISEKDTWLNARKRAHGERIRDDTSLLKKTLKRKEKQKKKSEKEWTERIEGVKKGQDIRQKKREANIQKRKEDKGGKGKKSKGAKKGKPKARPGFEGSFRAKAPTPGARRR